MASDPVLLETSASGIATITLNRAKSLNALNAPLLNGLVAALRQSQDAKVIILQGAGDRAFCAGEDLKETLAPETGSAEELHKALERLQDLTRLMASCGAMIITAVQGFAVGGGAEIALTADFVIGGPNAQFRFPEVVIGHAATGGITQRLPTIVGLLKAKELLLTGRFVGAHEALGLGMLSEIAADPKARARELAQTLAALPRTAASGSKLSLERATFPTQEAVLQDEIQVARLCFSQNDASKAFTNFASRNGLAQASPPARLPDNLNTALAAAVTKHPSRAFIRFGRKDCTFADFDTAVAQMAGNLRAKGLEPGDRVLTMMKNSLEMVSIWFAATRLGAVWAPINPEAKSATLAGIVKSARPKIALADPEYLQTLKSSGALKAEAVFCASSTVSSGHILLEVAAPVEAVATSGSDTSALLFTSGTTGRSKPCILPHGYFTQSAQTLIKYLGLDSSDVLFCPFPLFHIDATALTVVPALLLGAVAALSVRYSASTFWKEIRETRATVYDFMGATLALTYKQPPLPDDLRHSVRLAWGVPVPAWAADYETRFGHPLFEVYGSCESGLPAIQQGNRVPGSCGTAVEGYSLRVADDKDRPVPPNTVGRLLVRSTKPNAIFRGYFGSPSATADAFADSWLHTGDLVKVDHKGNLFYVGRLKDVIRRRGENVNAFEVEEELLAHPDVINVAAFGISSQLGQGTEEDIKVAVVPKPGAEQRGFTEQALWTWAIDRMARFQVPDVVEFVGNLKQTSTGKIEKSKLKKSGGKRFQMPRVSKL